MITQLDEYLTITNYTQFVYSLTVFGNSRLNPTMLKAFQKTLNRENSQTKKELCFELLNFRTKILHVFFYWINSFQKETSVCIHVSDTHNVITVFQIYR